MRKLKLQLEEKIIYRHEVVVETEMDDEELEDFLDSEVDCKRIYFDDITYVFNSNGLKVIEVTVDDSGIPTLECDFVENYEEDI